MDFVPVSASGNMGTRLTSPCPGSRGRKGYSSPGGVMVVLSPFPASPSAPRRLHRHRAVTRPDSSGLLQEEQHLQRAPDPRPRIESDAVFHHETGYGRWG